MSCELEKKGKKTKNSVTALFARTDISEGSYILPSSMATSFILNGNSLSNLENNLKIDGSHHHKLLLNFKQVPSRILGFLFRHLLADNKGGDGSVGEELSGEKNLVNSLLSNAR